MMYMHFEVCFSKNMEVLVILFYSGYIYYVYEVCLALLLLVFQSEIYCLTIVVVQYIHGISFDYLNDRFPFIFCFSW